jgi:CHAT domain-containing protein
MMSSGGASAAAGAAAGEVVACSGASGEGHLAPGAARRVVLAEYFTTGEATYLFVLRADLDEPHAARIEMPLEALRRFVVDHFREARDPEGRLVRTTGDQVRWMDPGAFREFLNPLVAPLAAPLVEPGDVLWLVPHDVLHYLPLHALEVEGIPLIERNPVAYAPSASVLKYCRAGHTGRRDRALIVADSRADRPVAFARDQAFAALARLRRAEVLVGEEADRAHMAHALAADDPGVDVVHLAVHGLFNPTEPMQSGVELADGVFTAEDLAGIELDADLAILSACESGVNDQQPGDELIGLTRSLLYSGLPSVIVSLWRVDELSTSILVDAFYREWLEGRASKVEALRRAQLVVRDLTAGEALLYTRAARDRLADDPRAVAYVDATEAEIRFLARDYPAALAGARTLLERADLPYELRDRVRALVGRSRLMLSGGPAPPIDHDRRLYEHLYYWAPFTLVGDWR